MHYIGNKQSLVPLIYKLIEKHNIKGKSICDLFAGTHSVGVYFKKQGYTVLANDWQEYSNVLGKAYIENNTYPEFKTLVKKLNLKKIEDTLLIEKTNYELVIDYLNKLKGVKGFVYNNYCPGGTEDKEHERMYFTNENGMKFDKIRKTLNEWKESKLISESEFYILLATLIKAMDKVSNTTGVYGAFLKKFKGAALKEVNLLPIEIVVKGDNNHHSFCGDANLLVKEIEADIFYLDPPYNTRQYASNYHVLETMAVYDNPDVRGKTGLRNYDNQKSPFSSKVKVKEAFEDLIHNIKTKTIILSYSNEGILSNEDIMQVLSKRGEVIKEEIEYRRYKSDVNTKNRQYKDTNTVQELLYIVKVNN